MMDAKTEKRVLVKYPIDVVYDSLISIFPVKNFKSDYHYAYYVKVLDSSNHFFVMDIRLNRNTPDTTIVHFIADYPHAISDIGSGGKRAIYAVLEALLNDLDKKPKTDSNEDAYQLDSDVEVADPQSFVNPMKSEKNTSTILIGYALCIISFILLFIPFTYYNQQNSILPYLAPLGLTCYCLAITAAVLLQISENSKSVMHGRIQTCICGVFLIILGCFTHYILAFLGIVIPAIVFIYFYKRSKY